MATSRLSSRREAGGGLLLVALDVDAELARAYTTPGQYVEVTTAAGKGFFVLGGEVGAPRWELLVRNAGDAADALHSLPLGSPVAISVPLGPGFPVAQATARPLVVAVVGSALAVARPVMELRIAERSTSTTFLFLGLRAPTDLPIADEVTRWSAAGVQVVLCLSRGELGHHVEVLPRARRSAGYVQSALERAVETGEVPRGALLVAAGPTTMLADLRSLAASGALEVVTNV